ncbi:MAG: hypothetical protein IJW21_07640, partial [Clostridia bacterium]|nr:hypothetical protein [Clostridia bacterium]
MKKKNKGSVAPNSGKPEKINGRTRAALIIMALCLVSCFFAGVTAKYVSERGFDSNKITAKNFYFTVDLMGDTNSQESLSKSVNIYGGETKKLKFKVQNFFDKERFTTENITYT